MMVLIITRSDDNASVDAVSAAIRARGGTPIRLDSDRYPDLVRLSSVYDRDGVQRTLRTPAGTFDLGGVSAVWYRRFDAGAALPVTLGDMRTACVQESRRTLFGAIAALPCFHMDPLESVRRADHKELQIRRAAELGLDTPRTLFSNDPDEVRAFFDSVHGRMVTKMQHSFAIYRDGLENVVFTTPVQPDDLETLAGLRYSPMTFQENIDKAFELRTTIVGRRVMTAAIDSQRTPRTAIDWRRDGVGLIDQWVSYDLPSAVEGRLLQLVAELGLNYAACDFIVTPDGRHVFLEVNAVGEFFWLEQSPGLPISSAIADVLLDLRPRHPIDVDAWRNGISGSAANVSA